MKLLIERYPHIKILAEYLHGSDIISRSDLIIWSWPVSSLNKLEVWLKSWSQEQEQTFMHGSDAEVLSLLDQAPVCAGTRTATLFDQLGDQ